MVDGFLQRWQFLQCAGAMDASHIPIIAPPVNAKSYYKFSLNFVTRRSEPSVQVYDEKLGGCFMAVQGNVSST